jgi:acyl carrier protein
MSDLHKKLTEVFRDLFDDDDIEISRETTADDIDDWDSTMHVTLMINIETEFGIRFSSKEIAGFKNVGELMDSITSKVS